jgi:hypothetical protein
LLQILSPQKPRQSPGQDVGFSLSEHTASPQRSGEQSPGHDCADSVPVQILSPHLLQSGPQVVGVSPAAQAPSPQKPQSSGQNEPSFAPQ